MKCNDDYDRCFMEQNSFDEIDEINCLFLHFGDNDDMIMNMDDIDGICIDDYIDDADGNNYI